MKNTVKMIFGGIGFIFIAQSDEAEEKIKKVAYTYKELFGGKALRTAWSRKNCKLYPVNCELY